MHCADSNLWKQSDFTLSNCSGHLSICEFPTKAFGFALRWRMSICWIYRHINICEQGATLFISSGGSCYHPPPNFLCLSSLTHSLPLSTSIFLSLFFFWHPTPTFFWHRLPSYEIASVHEVFADFYLPIVARACLRVRIYVCKCSYNSVQLATCCEVLHVLGACSNASFHCTAKLSLILWRTGSAFTAFVNVKYAARGAGFYWGGLSNHHPCSREIKTPFHKLFFSRLGPKHDNESVTVAWHIACAFVSQAVETRQKETVLIFHI